MDASSYIGIAGLILISLGWVTSIRNKPPASLSGLYSLESLMLFIYAFLQRDIVFSVLNISAVFISGYQFVAKLIEDKRKEWKTHNPTLLTPTPTHSLADTPSTKYNHIPHNLYRTTCYIH